MKLARTEFAHAFDIEPCTKCGGEGNLVKCVEGDDERYAVVCSNPKCEMFNPSKTYEMGYMAVRRWNQKIDESKIDVYALLDLADECDDAYETEHNIVCFVIANRIREACGVVDE